MHAHVYKVMSYTFVYKVQKYFQIMKKYGKWKSMSVHSTQDFRKWNLICTV
jgi:hypothetical protein